MKPAGRITPDNPLRLTERAYLKRVDEMIGVCRECRSERGTCEPDATDYPCDDCGQMAVWGIENLLIAGMVAFIRG